MNLTSIFYVFIMSLVYMYIDKNVYIYANSYNIENTSTKILKCQKNNNIKEYHNYFNYENIQEKELHKKQTLYDKLNNFGCVLKEYEKYLQRIEKKEKILNKDLIILTEEIDSLFHKYKKTFRNKF